MRHTIKRITALTLSFLLTFSVMSSASFVIASAADYYINFINASDKLITTIVENASIQAVGELPPGHAFDSAKPFEIVDQVGTDKGNLFQIEQDTTGKYYTITAKGGAADGTVNEDPSRIVSPKTYTLKPKLLANITDGLGAATLRLKNITPGASNVDSVRNVGIKVKSKNTISVTSPNSITLTVDAPETETTGPTFKRLAASDGTGNVFKPIAEAGVIPLQESYSRNGSTRTFGIRFGTDSNIYSFDISLNPGEYIQQGSTIELQYNLQEINALTLTVITPAMVLQNVSNAILASPTDPMVTDGKTPYVVTTDPLYSMRNTFNLLQRIALYNDTASTPKVTIGWEWSPTNLIDDTHKNVVNINKSPERIITAKLAPLLEDVAGKLVADPVYKLDKSFGGKTQLTLADIMVSGNPLAKPAVAINVLGTGSAPVLKPSYKTFYDPDNDRFVTSPLLGDKFPASMILETYGRASTADKPNEVVADLRFGKGYGRAEKVVITSSRPEVVDVLLDNSVLPYKFGDEILNKDPVSGSVAVKFAPKTFGKTDLVFTFFVFDSAGKLVESPQKIKTSFTVEDNTPLSYAELSKLDLVSDKLRNSTDNAIRSAYPQGKIGFGFTSANHTYEDIKLPNMVDELIVTPTRPDGKGVSDTIKYMITGLAPTNPTPKSGTVNTGDSFTIKEIPVGAIVTVSLTVTAQNGDEEMYILKVTRQSKSSDSRMGKFSITNKANEQLLPSFVSSQLVYNITVPYNTRWVKPVGVRADLWAQDPTYTPALENSIDTPGSGDWLRLRYPGDMQTANGGSFDGNSTTVLKSTIVAEDGTETTYTFNITRSDPSTNDLASLITVKGSDGKEIKFEDEVVFDKDKRDYSLRIPYSMVELAVEVTAEDVVAQDIRVQVADKPEEKKPANTQGKPVTFSGLGVANTPGSSTEKKFVIKVSVASEKGNTTNPPYTITVTRNAADNNSLLSNITLQDQDDAVIPAFSFNPMTILYTIPVSFKVETVKITPTARSPLARIEIDGIELDSYTTSHTISLRAGETKTVSVKVFPEDLTASPAYREYTLIFSRAHPSTDARLRSLKVDGGEEFEPVFEPSKTLYSVVIPEGKDSVTFTVVPNDSAASIMINGEGATSGKPSAPYTPIDAVTNVPIVVTAEDGKTTMTYTVKVTNRNLIPKSTNADLYSLTVNYGSMTPRFKPSITEYEVAVKDDTASVDIIPIPEIDGSTVEVLQGSKKIGDYSDNYSAAITDGENDFTIKVTAEEGKVTKSYSVIVYRKDEEKQGVYKPITSEIIDFTTTGEDVVVDISKYAIVSAEVFNTLKTEYPDKNIIFEGNDYSLTVRGKDIAKLIPHEQTFDLSLSFTSPLENEIWDVILSDTRNNRVDPLFVHFNHHGALPAPMTLTLTLGRQYRSMSATWNYYNEERERIDFYGGVKTNSRGTFSVKLTHMSTYIFSDHQIVGAENKSGDQGLVGGITGGGSKQNPNTGAD